MPLQKNQLLTLRIERLSSDGSGVAHSPEGEAVFVPGTAPGDEAQVRIVKDCGRYAFGILDKLLTPSPDRIPVDCAVAGPCGTTAVCRQSGKDRGQVIDRASGFAITLLRDEILRQEELRKKKN